MGILLQPTWWQDLNSASPPTEWEALTQTPIVTFAPPAAARFNTSTPLPNGCPVVFNGGTPPTPFVLGTTYYVVALPSIDNNTFALSAAPGAAPIVATDGGTSATLVDMRYYFGLNGDIILLLHFDGTNHSTTIVDSSSYGETNILCNYFGAISTVKPQFGTGSFQPDALSSPGAGGDCEVIYNNAIDPLPDRYQIHAGEDFTMEISVWQATPQSSTYGTLIAMNNETMTEAALCVSVDANTGHLRAQLYNQSNTSILTITTTAVVPDSSWHAVSFERKGTTFYLYLDGVVVGSGTATGNMPTDMAQLSFGLSRPGDGNEGSFSPGFLDEFRFTKKVSLHGGLSYTPATAAFPNPGVSTLQFIGNVTAPKLLSGMFGMLRLRYDVVQISTGTLNFTYDIGAGPVTQALTNTLNASGIISICLDGASKLDWGIGAGNVAGVVAFSEAPGDSTYGNVNFNCMCPELPTFQTLTELRNRMMYRLGFGAQTMNPPPGMTGLLNEFLIGAQSFLWKKYPATFTRRLFTWEMQPLQRFYGVLDNNDDTYRNLRMDFTKGIEWSGIYDQKNTWTPITEGIPPELYTMVTQAGRPQRYELRECIEVFPTPDVPYTLVLKGHIDLQPFAADDDATTIDSEVVFLFALATAKAHYGQVDATGTMKMAMDYLGELTAGTHLNKRYIPGPRPLSPVVKPQMVTFQDGN